jgi:hypothetical protein
MQRSIPLRTSIREAGILIQEEVDRKAEALFAVLHHPICRQARHRQSGPQVNKALLPTADHSTGDFDK